jgi:hypothetical protein
MKLAIFAYISMSDRIAVFVCHSPVVNNLFIYFLLQTVRLWQGSDDGHYTCRQTLKDHSAEVCKSNPIAVPNFSLFLVCLFTFGSLSLDYNTLL